MNVLKDDSSHTEGRVEPGTASFPIESDLSPMETQPDDQQN